MDKSNGDGVETENSFTLGVIAVAVSGLEEATSGRETTTSGLTETANTAFDLAGQQSESLWTAEKYSL